MKKIKTITLVYVLILSLLSTSTNIFAENELEDIEVLTFSKNNIPQGRLGYKQGKAQKTWRDRIK